MALTLSATSLVMSADQVYATGELRSTYRFKGKVWGETNSFRLNFDADTMLMTYSTSGLDRYSTPLLSYAFVISKSVNASVCTMEAPQPAGADFQRPELAWVLGNCGGGLETRAFRTVRCVDLLRIDTPIKVRPFAPSFELAGKPVSLITEGHYSYSGTGITQIVTCEVRVSSLLRQRWRTSPLLHPELNYNGPPANEEEYGLIEREMKETILPDGFLLEEIRFSGFTNAAGLRFPTVAEFSRYVRSPTNGPGNSVRSFLFSTASLSLKSIKRSSGQVSTRPVEVHGKKVNVTDQRLFDRNLRVSGVNYAVSNLTSMDISPLARSQFARDVEAAKEKRTKGEPPR